MTATGQNITIYAGDDPAPVVTVTDQLGNIIDLSVAAEIVYSVKRDLKSAAVLTRTLSNGGGISIIGDGSSGQFQIQFTSAETAALTGFYLQTATVTDTSGNVTTVTTGRLGVGQAPTWTYSGDPSVSTRDAVRFYMQDTDYDNQQLMDAEIDRLLCDYPNIFFAAAAGCRALGAKYSRKVNKRVGDFSINYSDIAKNYLIMADELTSQGEQNGATIYVGGTSRADMNSVRDNSDRVKPPFYRGQFTIPNGYSSGVSPDDDGDNWS